MPRSLDSPRAQSVRGCLVFLHLCIRIPAPLHEHASPTSQPPSTAHLVRRWLELHADDIIRRADVDALDRRVDEEDVVPRLRTGTRAKRTGTRGAQAQSTMHTGR